MVACAQIGNKKNKVLYAPSPDCTQIELGKNNLLQTQIGITKFTLEWYLFEFCLISQAFCPQLPSPRLSCNTHRHQPRQFQAAWRRHHETKLVSAFLSATTFRTAFLSATTFCTTTYKYHSREIGRDLYSYMDLRGPLVDPDTDLDNLCFETTQIKKKLIQHGLINLNKGSQLGNKRKEKLDLKLLCWHAGW